MKPPFRIPGLPEHDTLVGAGHPVMGLQASTPVLPDILGTRAVWLAPDACLVRSHLPPAKKVARTPRVRNVSTSSAS